MPARCFFSHSPQWWVEPMPMANGPGVGERCFNYVKVPLFMFQCNYPNTGKAGITISIKINKKKWLTNR